MKQLLALLTLIICAICASTQPALALVTSIVAGAALTGSNPHGYLCILTGPITLLDLAMRSGENVGAVVEDVTTTAPEWATFPAVPREGTTYDVLRRTELPRGGFRDVGGGVQQSKSAHERDPKKLYFFDAQMGIDEATVQAQTSGGMASTGDVLADEATATVRGSAIQFGIQAYYGVKADAKGFEGISSMVGAGDDLDAGGGGGADTTSVYLVWLDPDPLNPQGVHFSVGKKGMFNFGDWKKQQVTLADQTRRMDYVNNFSFYVGLAASSARSVFRIKKVKAGFAWTDDLGAQLLAKVPLGRRANLRWLANPNAGYLLQKSRTTDFVKSVPTPTECQGVPIIYTDSIVNTEKSGALN